MARYWSEIYDETRHWNRMLGAGPPADESPDSNILPRSVFFVAVAGFTFEFHSLDQVRAAIEYFSHKIRPCSRIPYGPAVGGDHGEAQRWFDRLPMRLLKEPRRIQVLKALKAALEDFNDIATQAPR